MTEHTVSAYENELKGLAQRIAEMGGLAERQIASSIDALIRSDMDLARRVRHNNAQHMTGHGGGRPARAAVGSWGGGPGGPAFVQMARI